MKNADVIDSARRDLNDADAVRYSPIELLAFLQDGVHIALSLRPDVRFGRYGSPIGEMTIDTDFLLPDRFRAAITAYIVGRAQMGDDEHAVSERAAASLAAAIQGIAV